jgi:hypothetical protein
VDGHLDCDDDDCAADAVCIEDCDDGYDNDSDGYYDCDDTDCASEPACQTDDETCDNGTDDDADGHTDCDDADCAADPACQSEGTEICDNDADDDADGQTDCDDADCAADAACAPEVVEECENSIDDDEDGQFDCDDDDCAADAVCIEDCDDGYDNDSDGYYDCDDTDCVAGAVCVAIASVSAEPIDGTVAAQDASFASGSAVFEIGDLGGYAAMVVMVSDQADTCELARWGNTSGSRSAIVAMVNYYVRDPNEAFPVGIAPDDEPAVWDYSLAPGTGSLNFGSMVSVGGATTLRTRSWPDERITITKIGEDGRVSISGVGQVTYEFSDTARYDTDIDMNGTLDARAIPPSMISLNVQNATECSGLMDAILF